MERVREAVGEAMKEHWMVMQLTDEHMVYVEAAARAFDSSTHSDMGRPLNETARDGAMGEIALRLHYGMPITDLGWGKRDQGWDIEYEGWLVDVKATPWRWRHDPVMKVRKPRTELHAEVYALTVPDPDSLRVILVGWATADQIVQQATLVNGDYGYPYYKMGWQELRPFQRRAA